MEPDAQFFLHFPGSLSKLTVGLVNSPGASFSYTVTVRKNGADTVVLCSITGTATACVDNTHTVTFAAGDYIDIQVVPSSGNPAGTPLRWTAKFS